VHVILKFDTKPH